MKKILKNKYLIWMVMQIIVYFIKRGDFLILNNMEESGWLLVSCIAIITGSVILICNIWDIDNDTNEAWYLIEARYNEVIAKDEPIKPSEYEALKNEVHETDKIIVGKLKWSMLLITIIVLSSIVGIENLYTYKRYVHYYKIANGILNDGKAIKTGCYEDGEQ